MLCRQLDLFSQSLVAIDGSKFKAVNNRDRNFTQAKLRARMEQIEKSIDRYLAAMDTADRTQSDVAEAKTSRLQDKIEKLRQQMQALKHWMGATHFLTKTLPRVSTEMSLHVLAYNLKRLMNIFGIRGAVEAHFDSFPRLRMP